MPSEAVDRARYRLPFVKALRRLAPFLVIALLAATASAAAGESPSTLDARVAQAQAREAQLADQVDGLSGQIRMLEAQVGDVSTRLTSLEEDLALHERRLAAIDALLAEQARELTFLRGQSQRAKARLSERLVQIYEEGEPSTVEIVLGARSLSDALDRLDYMSSVAAQDRQIAAAVAAGRRRVIAARANTARAKQSVAAATRIVAYRRNQAQALRAQLIDKQRGLASSRARSQQALAQTKADERQWREEADALRAASANVASELTSSSPSSPQTPSSSGLIWPVSGPITSPYGLRWGSLHPGIDIGAGMGTPIHAAAAGIVVVAAYSGGYGNLIVIDHGGGLATAYAHQSSFAVGAGTQVAQGQVIGYVGSTGFSTGPHLHFEVRVNGSPVDPMGYL